MIIQSEEKEVSQLLEMSEATQDPLSGLFGEFGSKTFNRVHDMFDVVDFSAAKHFVLVGCGAFPATAFHVCHRTDIENIACLDLRRDAIDTLRLLREKYNLSRIAVHPPCDGCDHDYSGADIVYVANLVSPKFSVIKRIVATAGDGVQIIVREPYAIGRLFTEAATDKLPANLSIKATGPYEPAFYSRNVFLGCERQ